MAIPNIFNVIIISLLFFLIFGIIGVNYFKGAFFYCHFYDSLDLSSSLIETKWDCLNSGGTWTRYDQHFDNIFEAILTLFQMATTEGWITIMDYGLDSVGIDMAPRYNHRQYWVFFFIFFIIVGNFFVLNLFVGVVISRFYKEKETLGKSFLLTKKQKEWLDTKKLCMNVQPKVRVDEHESRGREIIRNVVQSKVFEIFILICIILNTIVLSLAWYDEPDELRQIADILNYIFAAIFTLEAAGKIVGLGFKPYFVDNWNTFDFFIVVGSLLGIILSESTNLEIGPQATLIRAFRISRIFRLIRKAQRLKIIFETFLFTIPALTNVGGLLMLFLYLYSILGVFLFAEVKLQEHLNEHANFQNFWSAFLTLFRVSTGEGWNFIMLDAIR